MLPHPNLYRSYCGSITYSQGGSEVRWPGSIRHRSPLGGRRGGRWEGGAVAAGVITEVFKVFFLDRILQRLVEQIIETWVVVEVFLVSQDSPWTEFHKR